MKLIKIISYLFFFITFLFSCSVINKKEEKQYFEFNEEKQDIKIIEYEILDDSLDYQKTGKVMKTEYIFNDSLFLIIEGENFTNNLIVKDILNASEKKNNFDKTNYEWFTDFGYINSDSIFLIYYDTEDYGYHDSLIFLCNSEGKIIKSYTLKDAPVLCRDNSNAHIGETTVRIFPNRYEPLTYKDNKLFLHFARRGLLGDTTYLDLPIAGYVDTKENKFYPINIEYPDIEFGKQFFHSADNYYFSTFAHDGDLLYAFKYTPTIIKYNYKTGKSVEVQIKSKVFDTIYPFLSEEEVPKGHDFSMPYPKYFKLQYDKYRNLYYRFVLLPSEYGKEYIVIVADTSFNVIAEGFAFSKGQYEFFYTDDYFFENKKCYKMNFKDGTNTELISEIKLKNRRPQKVDKPLNHYVKNYANIKEKNYTAVFMWQSASCENTTNFFLTLFQTNQENYQKYNVYLFIIADKTQFLNEVLDTYNLSPKNHSNIIIDSTFEYGAYNNFEVHSLPRIIKVRENSIIADTIISGEDGGIGVQKFILESAKEQKKLKEE